MVITIVDGIPNVLTCFILHNFLRSQGPSCTSLYNAPGSYDTENIKTHVVLPGICHDEELSQRFEPLKKTGNSPFKRKCKTVI